jgi:hypothetical protein
VSKFLTTFAIGTPNRREITMHWPESEDDGQPSSAAAEGKLREP